MGKVAAFVDGDTEWAFIKMTFPSEEIHPVNCLSNGNSVSLDLVSQEIVENLELLGGNFDTVMILWDKEHRTESCAKIAADIATLVNAAGNTRKLIFGIKDVEIENWILADENYMKTVAGAAYAYNAEGQKVKHVLQAYFPHSLSPNKKAKMLASCMPSEIEMRSPSFKAFKDASAGLSWWWLEF